MKNKSLEFYSFFRNHQKNYMPHKQGCIQEEGVDRKISKKVMMKKYPKKLDPPQKNILNMSLPMNQPRAHT